MKSVSPEFSTAFIQDEMYLNHKLVIEFGNNRFNDGQVVTASSTKPVNRGIDSLVAQEAEFWKASDVFNNKNRNTMKWLVCDAGALLTEEEDGSGYRAIHIDNPENVLEYERGWWSENKSDGTGVFSSPEWVKSEFFEEDGTTPYQRRTNKVTLYLTEGYPNMSEVTVEYKNVAGSWVPIASSFNLGVSQYEVSWWFNGSAWVTTEPASPEDVIITGLRVTVHSTQEADDWARVNELQAYWTKDISEYLINADVNEVREEYERTVPVGTTAANTLNVELDNTEGLFNEFNGDSVYAPYIGANCRVEFYIGIDVNQGVGTPAYEYVQMGEFWTDEWENEAGSMTARFNSRDFSKFLQDEMLIWGRVWRNKSVLPVIRDMLLMLGLPLDRINIDEANLRGYQLLYVKDQSPWQFFGEVAFADQGMFGFDYKGDFYYQSYNVLNNAPYTTPQVTMSWDNFIVDGSHRTQLYLNKVKVEVSPLNDTETGVRRIWSSESPVILSWAKLATSIDADDTTITVEQAQRQDTGNLTDNGWTDRNGYLFFPNITYETRVVSAVEKNTAKGGNRTPPQIRVPVITGGELVKYKDRTDSAFTNCERGYLDTVPEAHTAGAYIGEARVWDIDFDNAPAISVKYPLVTAIHTLEKLVAGGEINGNTSVRFELEPQAYIIHWENDAFGARLAIGNIVEYYTWLAGTGQTIKDFDDKDHDSEFTFYTAVAGEVFVEKAGSQQTERTGENLVAGENADYIRRYGKNEIEVDNQWIQTRDHAEDIAEILISEYRFPRRVIDVETICTPALESPDRVRISNFPQLDIENVDYHIIRINYSYDGGLKTQMTLREVKPA